MYKYDIPTKVNDIQIVHYVIPLTIDYHTCVYYQHPIMLTGRVRQTQPGNDKLTPHTP